MKIQPMSDIHTEFHKDWNSLPLLNPQADLVLLAGDIATEPHDYRRFIQRLRSFSNVPIVAVLGNHEFYGNNIKFSHNEYKAACQEIPDFHLLENSTVDFENITVIGATLWTDFDNEREILAALVGMNDFNFIEFEEKSNGQDLAQEMIRRHRESRKFIKKALKKFSHRETVVLTHHCPSRMSIHPRYQGSRLNSAFCSNLEELFYVDPPTLWVSGHVHNHFDYNICGNRVVHNPLGYPFEQGFTKFDKNLLIEI